MFRDSVSTMSLQPLDYLQTSPIRGQLETNHDATKPGWRYLQCTDTPNELKVLLPPRTAQYYGQILKAEAAELAKLQHASWDRILEIRHLKDRMIRKCQRLVLTYVAARSSAIAPFLTLNAPPDFRLKEMEKWIRREEQSRVDFAPKKKTLERSRSRSSFCCNRCAAHVSTPHHVTASGRISHHASISHRSSNVERTSPKKPIVRRYSVSKGKGIDRSQSVSPTRSAGTWESREELRVQGIATHESRANYHSEMHESRMYESTHVESHEMRESKQASHVAMDNQQFHLELSAPREEPRSHDNVALAAGLLSSVSPEPLPHPYRGSAPSEYLPLGASLEQFEHRDEVPGLPNLQSFARPTDDDNSSSPPSEREDGPPADNGRPLLRRRSSLKRNSSALRLSMNYSAKTVSWAMDQDWTDQMSKYEFAAGEVEEVDREWDTIFAKYQEEMAGLKAMRKNVSKALSDLLAEAERLRREDEVIREQEDRLRTTFDQLDNKHRQYRAKVKSALEETKQVLTLCSAKRNHDLQGS